MRHSVSDTFPKFFRIFQILSLEDWAGHNLRIFRKKHVLKFYSTVCKLHSIGYSKILCFKINKSYTIIPQRFCSLCSTVIRRKLTQTIINVTLIQSLQESDTVCQFYVDFVPHYLKLQWQNLCLGITQNCRAMPMKARSAVMIIIVHRSA